MTDTPNANYKLDATAGGLKAAKTAAGAKTTEMLMVPVENLVVRPGFNVRIPSEAYQAGIAELAKLIAFNGFDRAKPLAGFIAKEGEGEDAKDVIIVVDGHRRLEAVHEANAEHGAEITVLPVVLEPADTTAEELTFTMITSATGKALLPLELAIACERLSKAGVTPETICTRLQITERYLSDLKLLVTAKKAVRDLVAADKVAATEAIKALRKDPEAAAKTLGDAVKAAEARGKGKATAKDIGDKVKMTKVKLEYEFKKGQIYDARGENGIEDVLHVLDGSWHTRPNTADEVTIEQDIKITLIVEMPKVEEPKPKAEGTKKAEAAKKATATKAESPKKGKAALPAPDKPNTAVAPAPETVEQPVEEVADLTEGEASEAIPAVDDTGL